MASESMASKEDRWFRIGNTEKRVAATAVFRSDEWRFKFIWAIHITPRA